MKAKKTGFDVENFERDNASCRKLSTLVGLSSDGERRQHLCGELERVCWPMLFSRPIQKSHTLCFWRYIESTAVRRVPVHTTRFGMDLAIWEDRLTGLKEAALNRSNGFGSFKIHFDEATGRL